MRVLAHWLDGFDMGLADEFELPVLTSLRERSAWATLDHGTDRLTGLAGEHLATGLDPRHGGRPSGVRFDVDTYACTQPPTSMPPIFGGVPTVVLDPCYFDLDLAVPAVQGLTDWGAHDGGAPARARPAGLRDEIVERFGAYPARESQYTAPWPSPEACAEVGASLTDAVQVRSEITRWLLGERLPDWDVALVGNSEAHSATEALYHGVDPSPRWASCPSRAAAGEGLRSVYQAIDTMVGDLLEAFPDAVHVVFALHGMGANQSDVPSMVLLGELMRRWAGDPTPDGAFELGEHGVPQLTEGQSWSGAVLSSLAEPAGLVRRAAGRVDRLRRRHPRVAAEAMGEAEYDLSWMPVMRHQALWPQMRAFALPSFYDGRIRVNVAGRESSGRVDPGDYVSVLDELEQVLEGCTNPISGEPIVAAIDRPHTDPFAVDPTEADLIVRWRSEVYGLRHPQLGTIGPFPPRRTGGHSSSIGRCMVHGPDIEPGDFGTRSSFDVVPTIFALSGSTPRFAPSGEAMPVQARSSESSMNANTNASSFHAS